MIQDFLKKYQEELISEKIQLKEDIDLLDTKIKEETKFLKLLEDSNDSYFVEFTPRDINAKNKEKAVEVRENLNTLNSEMESKSQQMKFFDGRLIELNALISNTAVINKPHSEQSLDNNYKDANIEKTTDSLIKQLSEIDKTILLDPHKAKIDLEKLISSLK